MQSDDFFVKSYFHILDLTKMLGIDAKRIFFKLENDFTKTVFICVSLETDAKKVHYLQSLISASCGSLLKTIFATTSTTN